MIEKIASIAPTGLDERQVRTAGDEGVGRCRHRLERDDVVIGGGVDLGESVAGTDGELDSPTAPGEDEGRSVRRRQVFVIERPVAKRTTLHLDRLALAGRNHAAIELQTRVHRDRHLPVGAIDSG